MKKLLAMVAMFFAILGCIPSDRDDGFKARKPVGALPADNTTGKSDTMAAELWPDTVTYGFSVELKGKAELHFEDDNGRHTGPATAEEYLPVLEAALKNPKLHEQERQALVRMRDQVRRTGSAADLAVTRRIPNMEYMSRGETVQALYRGAGTLDMRLVVRDHTDIVLNIKLFDSLKIRTATYIFTAAAGQEAGMDIGAMIDDLTLSLTEGTQGEQEKEVQPQRVWSVNRR